MESEDVDDERIDEESQETEFKVIPVQLVESYEGVTLASHSNSPNITLVKGKYYKQTYRAAWEQMPDFRGWLRGVEGEPTRAYCTYCHKTLHAHRLSLLKHTCTIRHQKAAQLHASRKSKSLLTTLDDKKDEEDEDQPELIQEDEGQAVACVESGELIFEDEESENEDRKEDQHDTDVDTDRKIQQNFQKNNSNFPVSTHVMDTSRGVPVNGLQVSLYKLIDGRWTYINEGVTSASGRFSQFFERPDFTVGRYKLHYDVDRYFESRKQATLFPFIEIIFDARSVAETYHIPLMLSPFGYSTYKG